MKRPQANCQRGNPDRNWFMPPPEVTTMTEESEIRPLQPIRRFDVFAETKRLEAIAHNEPEDVAKGYGIRIAKIVASRRFGGGKANNTRRQKEDNSERESSPAIRFAGEDGA